MVYALPPSLLMILYNFLPSSKAGKLTFCLVGHTGGFPSPTHSNLYVSPSLLTWLQNSPTPSEAPKAALS